MTLMTVAEAKARILNGAEPLGGEAVFLATSAGTCAGGWS